MLLGVRDIRPILRCACHEVLQKSRKTSLSRAYSDWYMKRPPTSAFAADVEGVDYRTTVTVNNASDYYLQIDRYGTYGFMLNNGFRAVGPSAVFPRSVLSWNVAGAEDINVDSLSLFAILEPKLDLLIVGAGETKDVELVDRLLYREMRAHGIGIEILPTYQACETFNLLNSERRCIAAALIPPGNIASNAHEHFIEPAMDKLLYAWKPDHTFNPDTGMKFPDDAERERAERELEDDKQKRKELKESQPKLPKNKKDD